MGDLKVGDRVKWKTDQDPAEAYILVSVRQQGYGSVRSETSGKVHDYETLSNYVAYPDPCPGKRPVDSSVAMFSTAPVVVDDRKRIWARCDHCFKLTYLKKDSTVWYCPDCFAHPWEKDVYLSRRDLQT